jgi:hypothetical protein
LFGFFICLFVLLTWNFTNFLPRLVSLQSYGVAGIAVWATMSSKVLSYLICIKCLEEWLAHDKHLRNVK